MVHPTLTFHHQGEMNTLDMMSSLPCFSFEPVMPLSEAAPHCWLEGQLTLLLKVQVRKNLGLLQPSQLFASLICGYNLNLLYLQVEQWLVRLADFKQMSISCSHQEEINCLHGSVRLSDCNHSSQPCQSLEEVGLELQCTWSEMRTAAAHFGADFVLHFKWNEKKLVQTGGDAVEHAMVQCI